MKEKNLKKIAKRCSRYDNKYDGSMYQSAATSDNRSCTMCNHYTKNNKCELDLIDEIKQNM